METGLTKLFLRFTSEDFMKYIHCLTFLLLLIPIPAHTQIDDIVGTVYDEKTADSMHGVEVRLVETGQRQVTDENGEFRFTDVLRGTYTLTILVKGYESTSVTVQTDASDVLKVHLKKIHQLETVDSKISRLQNPARRTNGETIRTIPGSADDPFRALTFHPSIGTVNDFMSVLSVRGGGPGDNVYYLDRLPLAFPYHLLGIVSTVSSNVIERVDVYPGGFAANFGADSQAVIDIHSYPQGKTSLGYLDGGIKTNYIYSELFLSGKIGKRDENSKRTRAATDVEFLKNQFLVPGNGYWYAFGRRSYLEPFFELASRLVNIEDLVKELPNFWSYQLKGVYKLNRAHGLVINTIAGYDSSKFQLASRETHESDLQGPVNSDNPFDAQGIHLYSQLSSKLNSILSLTRSFSETELAFGEGYFYRTAASNYMLRSDVTYEASIYTDVVLGLLLSSSPTTVISDGARRPEEGDPHYNFRIRSDGKIVSAASTENLHRFEGYAQTILRLSPYFAGTFGMRLSYFNLIDSLSLQPRGQLSIVLGSDASLHLSCGRYTQAPRLDQVVLGNRNLSLTPSLATHYVVELEQGLNTQTKIYLAGYYKDFQALIRYNEAEKQYQNTQVGYAQGVEISLQHKISEVFEGWLAYAYTASKRQDFPGATYRDYSYNKPHSMTAAALYSGKSWHIGAKWQYMSGVLYAPLEGRELYTNPRTKKTIWQPIYGALKRTAPYHRLDLSLRKSMRIYGWKLGIILEVWNLYNRENVLQVRYDSGFTKVEPNFQLPIVPFIGVTLEF